MPKNGYFDVAFAQSGDLTPVPDAAPMDGSVSYTDGYGTPYSTAVGSGGLNFPRAQHNQILNDITTWVQNSQKMGIGVSLTTGTWVSNTTATYVGNIFGTAFNQTLNTATSGIGGLDTGTIADSTWYYVYEIITSAGLNIVMSLSSSEPTVSGLIYYTLLGPVQTDSSGNLIYFFQQGKRVNIVGTQIVNTSSIVSNASVNFTGIAAPIAKTISGILSASTSTSNGECGIGIFSSANGNGVQEAVGNSTPASAYINSNYNDLIVQVPETVYYSTSQFSGSYNGIIYLTSYTI